jgi:hypothetical protein
MPTIPINTDIHAELQPVSADDSDLGLLNVRKPLRKETEELTPEQARQQLFHETAASGPNYASGPGPRMSVAPGEVCRFGGQPPRHTQVGRNCPHGMLELLEGQDDPELSK